MADINRLWPLQSQCVKFYGNPFLASGAVNPQFERNNIRAVKVPFKIFYGSSLKTTVKSHVKCAEVLEEWLAQIWKNARRDQRLIHAWGMDVFSGDFVPRMKRAGSTPSMHSFGCAWDFDAPRNGFKDSTPHFRTPEAHEAVVVPFKKLGGTWGGDWKTNTDGMHFQFARVG